MRVLLASDGSSDSRQATRWVRDLALPSDTSLAVLTVATLTAPPRDSQTMTELRESVATKARQAGERTAEILRRRWPEVETIVREGDPQVEVVRVAEETRVDMIALGASGRGSLAGSTSLAVARYAPCPVAIVRGRPRKVRRVLVAVDGSQGSRAALQFLSIFDLVREIPVSLLHVLPKSAVSVQRKPQVDADDVLADAATVFANARCPVERLMAEGDPAREILSAARRLDIDLVVLGSRGLRTVGRFLLGSVSETVLHHAARPVVIVRER